jgi:hypothetical protein
VFDGPINPEIFAAIIERVLVPTNGQVDVVVFDNLKRAKVRGRCQRRPAHTITRARNVGLGSRIADRWALITTARHSEAANSGAKRGTGRCTFESCRSPTGRKGPISTGSAVRQLHPRDGRFAEFANMAAPTATALVMSASTSSGQTLEIIHAHF